MDLAETAFTGIVVTVSVLGIWWLSQQIFIWKESRPPLTPNCLLTRKPLALLASQNSPWKFWSPEQKARRFLQAHGYDTQLWQLQDLEKIGARSPGFDFASNHWLLSERIDRSRVPVALSRCIPVDFRDRHSLLKVSVQFAEQDFI